MNKLEKQSLKLLLDIYHLNILINHPHQEELRNHIQTFLGSEVMLYGSCQDRYNKLNTL